MRISPFFFLLLLLSCEPNTNPATDQPNPSNDLRTQLLGTWEAMELNVQSATYLGEDTTYQQVIKEADWGRLYGVKPAQTTYTDDRKLRRTHYYTTGQLIDVVNGIWKVEGDSLHVIEPNITFSYHAELIGEQLKLTGLIDWDRDGEKDDNYIATFRLVGRTD